MDYYMILTLYQPRQNYRRHKLSILLKVSIESECLIIRKPTYISIITITHVNWIWKEMKSIDNIFAL